MTSVPGVTGKAAATLSFLQSLRIAQETMVLALTTEGGITGASKTLIASGTIDAILKASQAEPGESPPLRVDIHERFDQDDSVEDAGAEDVAATILAEPNAAAETLATVDTATTPPSHNDRPTQAATAGDDRPNVTGPLPQAGPAETRPMGKDGVETALSEPRSRETAMNAAVAPSADQGPNAALLREQAALAMPLTPAAQRARKATPSRSGPCTHCGKDRTKRPCDCAPMFQFFFSR